MGNFWFLESSDSSTMMLDAVILQAEGLEGRRAKTPCSERALPVMEKRLP